MSNQCYIRVRTIIVKEAMEMCGSHRHGADFTKAQRHYTELNIRTINDAHIPI